MVKAERTRRAELAMAELAMAEHDWRWDSGELGEVDEDGNDEWSLMSARFADGEATDEDWATMEALLDDEDWEKALEDTDEE